MKEASTSNIKDPFERIKEAARSNSRGSTATSYSVLSRAFRLQVHLAHPSVPRNDGFWWTNSGGGRLVTNHSATSIHLQLTNGEYHSGDSMALMI